MARMLGRSRPPQCTVCRTEPGLDCAEKGADKRAAKRIEGREWRRDIADELRRATDGR